MTKIEIVELDVELSQSELCEISGLEPSELIDFVGEGALEPCGFDGEQWIFTGVSVSQARIACRLRRDLGVNVAGAALAIELLEEVKSLRQALQRFSTNENAWEND